MLVIILLFIVLFLSLIIIINIFMITNKIKILVNISKKHQFDISYLSNTTSKIAIKQIFLFCLILMLDEKTEQFGIENLKSFFEISDEVLSNKKLLVEFYQKISQEDTFDVSIRNGKYIFNQKKW